MGGDWTRLFDTFNLTGVDTKAAQGSVPGTHTQSAATMSKNAANDAAQAQAQAIANLQNAQNTASTQAQNALDAKRRAATSSQDVFTSPLGLTTQAATSKKVLLGA